MEKKSITGTADYYEKPGSGVRNSPWLELAAAIVKCAADDYVRVLQKLWKKAQSIQIKRKLIIEKSELERFFHSKWYEALTDIDPDRLIHQCRILAKEREMAAISNANKKKIKQLLREEE